MSALASHKRRQSMVVSRIASTTLCAWLAVASLAPLQAASAGRAVGERSDDFSHSLPLTVSGKDAMVQFRLPQAVYLHARTAGLADLRLFDAHGTRLQFALIEQAAQAQTSRRQLGTKLFPVFGTDDKAAVLPEVEIRTSADGAIISVSTRMTGRPTAAAPLALSALVLDMRQPDASELPWIDALVLVPPAGTGSYSARVKLEASNDLKEWEPIGYSTVSWLVNSEAESLSNNRISFEPRAFRYARLTWQEGKPLRFDSIGAESPQRTEVVQPLERMTVKPIAGKFERDLVYPSSIAIPVQRLGLEFSEANIVIPALLGQYQDRPSVKVGASAGVTFQPSLSATFFQLSHAGRQRGSGDVALDKVHVAQWVLRPSVATDSKPLLRLSWMPATLVFLANGNAPYALAFGNAKVASDRVNVAQVAPGFSDAELFALEKATAGPLRQGATLASEQTPATAANAAQSRLYALWGVLLLGVGVLGYIAWRLLRQMRNEGETRE